MEALWAQNTRTNAIGNVRQPTENPAMEALIQAKFPGAISNKQLEQAVVRILDDRGLTPRNTLLATSLCADELARAMEDDFVKIYGNNFNLGGLSGFPFAGNTGFGAMSGHIPDDGYCFIIYGPHVGVTRDGIVGKVERNGIALVDSCCGSAIAASKYLQQLTAGTAVVSNAFGMDLGSDFQQGAVQELILPHGKRLEDAADRMVELPYALYDSQDVLMNDIVQVGAAGVKRGCALLGGIQINTGPTTYDYFHPLRFDFVNNQGEVIENLLPELTGNYGDTSMDYYGGGYEDTTNNFGGDEYYGSEYE